MKHWEIIADNLSKSGFSLGWVSAIDSNGRTIWIADAHRGDGKCFVVRADEKLTAFLELDNQCRRRRERKSPSANWSCNETLCASDSFVVTAKLSKIIRKSRHVTPTTNDKKLARPH